MAQHNTDDTWKCECEGTQRFRRYYVHHDGGGNIFSIRIRRCTGHCFKCKKESFVVIGKEGATTDGAGFIQKLWDDANSHFGEVSHLVKKDENGNIIGIWGVMSDFSRSFQPWEDFNQGFYLAGVECNDGAEAPGGWTKWVIPAYEYIYVERENDGVFPEVIQYLQEHDFALVGAVHDFTCPQTGKGYMFFPIKKL